MTPTRPCVIPDNGEGIEDHYNCPTNTACDKICGGGLCRGVCQADDGTITDPI